MPDSGLKLIEIKITPYGHGFGHVTHLHNGVVVLLGCSHDRGEKRVEVTPLAAAVDDAIPLVFWLS